MEITWNKSGYFEIGWVFFQREALLPSPFYGPKHNKAAFFACAKLLIYFNLARSVIIV